MKNKFIQPAKPKQDLPDPAELMLKREFPGNERPLENDLSFKELDYDYLPVSSTTDCTGLIPSAPQTEDDIESYEQLEHFLPRNYITKDEETDQDEKLKIWN